MTRRFLPIVTLLCCLVLSLETFAANGATTPTSWSGLQALDDDTLRALTQAQSTAERQTRTRALLSLSHRSLNRSYEEALSSLNLALTLLKEETDEAAFASAMRCQIDHRQALPGADARCERLADLGFSVNDSSVKAFIRLTQSLYYSREGKHEQAEALAKESTVLAEAARNPVLIAQANNWLGVQYNIKHLPKLSLLHYETAWEHIEPLDMPEFKQVLRFNTAAVYTQFGRHAEALSIFNEALAWPLANLTPTRQLIFRAAMAHPLIGIGDPARAERELASVVPALFANVQNDTKILAYDSLAQAQLAQGKVDEALSNFANAIALFDKTAPIPNPRGQAALIPYGSALRQAGRPQEALTVIDEVIAQINNDSPNNLLREAMLERSTILQTLGDSRGAQQAAAKAQQVSEQLNNEALQYQVSRLKMSIELEQSNQQLAMARAREASLKNEAGREATLRYLTLALGTLLLLVGYLLFSRHLQARVAQAERAANEKLEEKVRLRTEQIEEQMADRLQAEVERRHLLSKLAEGEKMRALGQLTAGVAHDFNNLMTAVTLTTEYLKSSPEDPKESRDALLDDILSATDSAARITGGLLAYARQQPLDPRVLQLDEFLEESTLIFRNTLGERNLLRTNFAPCRVKVDQGQLASALLNLVLNAKEAIGERGTVEIRLDVEDAADGDGQDAVISVTDSGCGMTEEALRRATEPFYTTKATGEGAGLGLSMVYGFARQSGGDLRLHSLPDRGARVELRLPLDTSPNAQATPPAETLVSVLPEGLEVLVVEDRDSVLTMLLRSLEHLGMKPSAATTADDARVMLDSGSRPDILLTDIMMPGKMDGHALAEHARHQHPDLSIILMSGYTESVDPSYVFLRKPFSIDELEQGLIAALARSPQPHLPQNS